MNTTELPTSNLKTKGAIALLCMLLAALTFPPLYPDYGSGLDASYRWALNYLFHERYADLLPLSYPFGPLALLSIPSPIGNNLIYYFLFYFFIRFLFLHLFFHRCRHYFTDNLLLVTVLTFAAAYFTTEIDVVLIGVVILSVLKSEEEQDLRFLLLAVFTAAVAIFIKSSIGISCFSIIGLSFFLEWIKTKQTASLMRRLFFSFAAFLSIALLVLHDPIQPFIYLTNVLHLAGGYAGSMALYPENNWTKLGLFLTFYFLLFLFLGKRQRNVFLLLLLPFYAFWKHSMVREDPSHNALMIYFLIVALSIILISEKFRPIPVLLSIASLYFFYGNFIQLPSAKEYTLHRARLSAFYHQVIHYTSFYDRFEKISLKSIREDSLSKELRNLIGNRSIDIYPWEMAYVPANGLNWKPRPMLELGASTSTWAIQKNADHFRINNPDRPEYLLVHLTTDAEGKNTSTLDRRYLLNDEPTVILNLLGTYQFIDKEKNLMVYKRSNENTLGDPSLVKEESVSFNEWIPVPDHQGILTAQTNITQSLKGKTMSFLYKDQSYYIDYLLQDSSIVTYRFIPSIASMGLWISPFINDFTGNFSNADALKIRFRCESISWVNDQLDIRWMQITPSSKNKSIYELFGKSPERGDTLLYSSVNTFDYPAPKEFTSEQPLYKDQNGSANVIQEQGYSSTFTLQTDSVWTKGFQRVEISTKIRYKSTDAKGALVIQTEGGEKPYWSGKDLQLTGNEWKTQTSSFSVSRTDLPSGKLKIYVWNNSSSGKILADDFQVRIVAYR